MAVKLFNDQSPQKYGTGPGSNLRSLDLQSDMYMQSDMLPTALCSPAGESLLLNTAISIKILYAHSIIKRTTLKTKLGLDYGRLHD